MANQIKGAIKKPGGTHKELGLSKAPKIPQTKLAKAAEAPGKLGERARMAKVLKSFKKAGA